MQASDRPGIANRSQPGGPLRGYTPAQAFFLMRLQTLIGKRQHHATITQAGDWRTRLLDKALYSTYCDCIALGVGDDARNLLRQMRQAQTN